MTSAADLIAAAQPAQATGNGTTAASLLTGAGFSPDQIAQAPAEEPSAKPSTAFERFKTGLADVPVGIAQLAGHVFGEEKISPQERAAYGVGANEPLSFDQTVAEREKAYQAGRVAAGKTGFDWTRTAGNAVNPINYMIPGAGGSGVVARVGSAALQGAAINSLNPVSEPGNFWGGKLWQSTTGAIAGLVGGTTIEALSRPLSWAAKSIKGLFVNPGASEAAAQGVVDQVLAEGGLKASDLPQPLVDTMRSQVASGTVNSQAIRAQAEAAALPVPMHLPNAMANGDAAQYSLLINQSKTAEGAAAGAQIAELHRQLLQNIDALGADGAPTTAEAGRAGLMRLAQIDQTLDRAKNAAYSAVRDSQGRAATLDAEHFFMNAQGALERDNVQRFLPSNIASVYEDITDGRLPFTVDTMTSFDKMLSRAQRTLEDGNAVHAIGLIRSAMADTPVSSGAGEAALAAYQRAKGLARAQFALADPTSQSLIPGYQAMLKGMGNASHNEFVAALQGGTANVDPEKWFTQNLTRGTPAGVRKLMGFLEQNGAKDTTETLQHGFMGAIRDQVVKGSDEAGRSVLSGDALNKVLSRRETLSAVLPQDTIDGLQRLANTATRIQRAPPNNSVNWSNTAPASINLQAAKEAAGTVAQIGAHLVPGGGAAVAAKNVVTDLASRRAARQAFAEAAGPARFAEPTSVSPAARAAAYRAAVPLSTLLMARPNASKPVQ